MKIQGSSSHPLETSIGSRHGYGLVAYTSRGLSCLALDSYTHDLPTLFSEEAHVNGPDYIIGRRQLLPGCIKGGRRNTRLRLPLLFAGLWSRTLGNHYRTLAPRVAGPAGCFVKSRGPTGLGIPLPTLCPTSTLKLSRADKGTSRELPLVVLNDQVKHHPRLLSAFRRSRRGPMPSPCSGYHEPSLASSCAVGKCRRCSNIGCYSSR